MQPVAIVLRRGRLRKPIAPVTTTFLNSLGGRLPELRLYNNYLYVETYQLLLSADLMVLRCRFPFTHHQHVMFMV